MSTYEPGDLVLFDDNPGVVLEEFVLPGDTARVYYEVLWENGWKSVESGSDLLPAEDGLNCCAGGEDE